MRKIFIALLTTILLLSATACSSNDNSNIMPTSSIATTEKQTSKNEINLDDYKKQVYSLTETIENASILLSNMAKYEYNYMSSLYKISGRSESDDVVDKGREWLAENGNVEENRIDEDFKTITNNYFEIKTLTVSENDAYVIEEKLSALYDEYSSFYTQATTANTIEGFVDDYNEHVNTINELVNVIKTATEAEE